MDAWSKVAKVLIFIGGFALLFDAIGPDRLTKISDRIRKRTLRYSVALARQIVSTGWQTTKGLVVYLIYANRDPRGKDPDLPVNWPKPPSPFHSQRWRKVLYYYCQFVYIVVGPSILGLALSFRGEGAWHWIGAYAMASTLGPEVAILFIFIAIAGWVLIRDCVLIVTGSILSFAARSIGLARGRHHRSKFRPGNPFRWGAVAAFVTGSALDFFT
ncbi:hypothetical protein [Nonomuraea sp. NPDC050643]|uniref:hypothetical protein n=1 Tax=Nonomuraea sp. NPDC050643 TaxID=3155660 RepID=UPI0033F16E03